MYVCVCVYYVCVFMYVCMYVCVLVMYMCVCVCVYARIILCVYVRMNYLRTCVCVCEYVAYHCVYAVYVSVYMLAVSVERKIKKTSWINVTFCYVQSCEVAVHELLPYGLKLFSYSRFFPCANPKHSCIYIYIYIYK